MRVSTAVLLLLALSDVGQGFLPTGGLQRHAFPALSSWAGGSSYLDNISPSTGTTTDKDDNNNINGAATHPAELSYGTTMGPSQAALPVTQDQHMNVENDMMPEGWTMYYDPESGNPYYYCDIDGTTSWDRPAAHETAAAAAVQLESNSAMNSYQQTSAVVPEPTEEDDPLPEGWTMHVDPQSGHPYYYFEADGTSSWERPQQQQQQAATATITAPVEEESPIPEEQDMERFLKMVSTEIGVKTLNKQNPFAITDVPYDVVLSKGFDQIEDSIMKTRQKMAAERYYANTDDDDFVGAEEEDGRRPTVLVLGTGWAAHAFVKVANTFDLRVVVVSPVNHFVFTPMLASAAVGTVEPRSMTEPIRVSNPTIDNYVEGRAVGIDVANKELTVEVTSKQTDEGIIPMATEMDNENGESPQSTIYYESDINNKLIQLKYDHLICAVGTGVRSSMVEGAEEHCYNLKTSDDSKRLRTAIGEALEFASRPEIRGSDYALTQERKRRVRFVIIGGGPTGVELAGELNDFLQEICEPKVGAYQRLANDYQVMLVHGGPDLLPMFNPDLRKRAKESLEAQGVEVRLNTRIAKVKSNFVKLQKKGSDELEVVPNGVTVWGAGNEPVPFVQEMLSQLPESAKGSAGRINVDPWLRCPTPTAESFGSILVLGDVACLEVDTKYSSVPAILPQTAQVAGQQGYFAARLLNRGYDLAQTPPRLPKKEDHPFDDFSLLRIWLMVRGLEEAPDFNFLNLGLLAYVGGGEALTQVQVGDVPLFDFAGKFAFALWRSVYLAKQVDSRNQAMISFDWLRSNVYGRDITRF
ncbi:Internal alternative NAD(P)H-ubiquinone oxidoreductase A1, mitochondrial [Seminavis robusta]|uniref:Internal alternative NAD(P)H-ubiquinone oxidoreductase A1, mitochondrial n=1 Tax=Seminavis robusta TaxID=568900 RepID=A0A9N8DFL9_9STRA|nr:Internal alternative NAD(P)H-ubiquinone oxidoreductase A1, mitochondrial [Seminavis robusta]|eukprot:Sro65_g036910.1 Internal alternative NAD(P)H-ubiquinone oxidoreductase A1, mitochondrial (810) ;mRNA; f:114868-117415